MSKTRLRTIRRAWQVALGEEHGIPKPHVRRLKKNYLLACRQGLGWVPLQAVKPTAIVTAHGKMGIAINLLRRGRLAVEARWRELKKQERLRKEGRA